MATIGNYHHVHLTSPDPRAAAEWYEEFLGGKIIDTAEDPLVVELRESMGQTRCIQAKEEKQIKGIAHCPRISKGGFPCSDSSH